MTGDQIIRGTETDYQTVKPLAVAQIAYTTDSKRFLIGTGVEDLEIATLEYLQTTYMAELATALDVPLQQAIAGANDYTDAAIDTVQDALFEDAQNIAALDAEAQDHAARLEAAEETLEEHTATLEELQAGLEELAFVPSSTRVTGVALSGIDLKVSTAVGAGDATDTTLSIPWATTTTAGYCPPDIIESMQRADEDIAALKAATVGGDMGIRFDTMAALAEYVVTSADLKGSYTYVREDENHSGAHTRYFLSDIEENAIAWSDTYNLGFQFDFVVENAPPAIATSVKAGLLKSSSGSVSGEVFINTGGVGELVGYDDIISRLQTLEAALAAMGSGTLLMTTAQAEKLAGIATGAQVNAVTSVAGRTGAVTLALADVGLTVVT
ncbi:MAG: hypothetical protein LBN05_09035 [Oscillospiraceae bacterium]|jgi:hypothetical protein|nr:hypothetical protein [Oscillospiraceae bacterium]